jgi:asparagine synthase (glutamine-hydrolysing)
VNRDDFIRGYFGYWQRLVPEEQKADLFTEPVRRATDIRDPFETFRRVFLFNERLAYDTPEDHIANAMYFEIKTFLPGLLLVEDRLAMANGLEQRAPFLDNDLVEFAQRLPVRLKLRRLEEMKRVDENEARKVRHYYADHDDGKNVLREAMAELIPAEIIRRRKQGFSSPDESWYRGANLEYVRDLLLTPAAASREFIQPAYVERILHEHCDLRVNHRLLIWSLLCFELWCRMFLRGETPGSLESGPSPRRRTEGLS